MPITVGYEGPFKKAANKIAKGALAGAAGVVVRRKRKNTAFEKFARGMFGAALTQEERKKAMSAWLKEGKGKKMPLRKKKSMPLPKGYRKSMPVR